MAALIGRVIAWDKTRTKEVHRLASQSVLAEANTWHTFASVTMERDGSGKAVILRDGKTLHTFSWKAEP
jgi:hypothetical protein